MSAMQVFTKRIYAPAADSDGARVLVDRLWPRGMTKAEAHLTVWLKAVAPSTELRVWFHQQPEQWDAFERRYRAELAANPEPLAQLRALAEAGPVTLLFSVRDEQRNHAEILRAFLLGA